MHVLHVHSGNLYGGVETFLLSLARFRALAPSMQMRVALTSDGRIAADLRAAGVPVTILGEARLSRPFQVWRARRNFASLLQSQRPDVVVCHQPWPLAMFGAVAKRHSIGVVLWMHMASSRQLLDRLAARVRPGMIICNSAFTASTLPKTRARVEVVYAPVDVDNTVRLKPDPTDSGTDVDTNVGANVATNVAATNVAAANVGTNVGTSVGRVCVQADRDADPGRVRVQADRDADPGRVRLQADRDIVIIQVSRMEPLKGHTILLDALGRLRDRAGWRCRFAGGAQRPHEAQYMESLRRRAVALGIADRVEFLGDRADVPSLLAGADIYCQPNIAPDAFGLSLVEAMAAGLPVVTSALGGAKEIVDETCGVLVTPRDSSALAAQLAALLENRGHRERLGANGPERARMLCDPATQMPRIAAILNRAAQ